VGPTSTWSRTSTIRIPEAYEIVRLPPESAIESPYGKLSLQIRVKDDTVRIERRFELTVHEITSGSYKEFLEFSRSVDNVLSKRLVMRRK
jgi:hypothetical protein